MRSQFLRGARYAVSAHLHEGGGAEEVRGRFPEITTLCLFDGETPEKQGIAQMYRDAGYEVRAWSGDITECPTTSAVLAVGDLAHMERCAARVSERGEEERPLFLWWVTDPAAVFSLPAPGVPLPELLLCDPAGMPGEGDPRFTEGLVRAMRLGVLFDRDLFGMVYSSFDPLRLYARGCHLIEGILAEDTGRIRSHLRFGEVMGEAVARIVGGEMTAGELLAVGMLLEMRLGERLGACRANALTDLDGALSYYGLPRGVCATGEELAEAFLACHPAGGTLSLTLPYRIGQCRRTETSCETVARLLRAGVSGTE